MIDGTSLTTLVWTAVVLGFYHGVNPGMGWPLAVSAGLMERKHLALFKALFLLACGHFLAMFATLLPFSLFSSLIQLETEIRIGTGSIVLMMGLYLLIKRRHPKILSRIHPSRLMLWSFLAAIAHGAGLMLVPFVIGADAFSTEHHGHGMTHLTLTHSVSSTLFITLIHTLAMITIGGIIATLFYFFLGLKFLSKTWFNLDVFWALSLICVGAFGILSTQ